MNTAVWNEGRYRRARLPALLLAALLVLLVALLLPHGGSSGVDRPAVSGRDVVLLTEAALPGLPEADPVRRDGWADVVLQDGTRRQHAAVAVLAGAFAIGLAALLLALTQRSMHDSTLAAACLLWAAHTGLTGMPAGNPVAQRGALLVILMCFAGLVGWYVTRLLRVRLRPAVGALATLALVLSGLVIWALDAAGAVDGAVAQVLVMLVAIFQGAWLLSGVVDRARHGLVGRRQPLQAWLVALLLAVVLGCVAQELFRVARWTPAGTELTGLVGSSLLTRWAVLLLLGLLAAVRFDQVAHAMHQLERRQRSWCNRMRETQRSLQAAEARLNSRKHADVLRDCLLRELHDEMGQRLASALRLARSGDGTLAPPGHPGRGTELQRLLDASLTDLHLAIGTLESGHRPLPEALRELRRRIEPLLRDKDVQLAWVIGADIDALALSSAEILQVLRIAQEALVNVVRHADGANHAAVQLEVLAGETGRHLRLMVYDDGHPAGLPPTACAPDQIPSRIGHGWITLQRQATALGAQLMVGPQPDGWSVELVMPLRGR